MRVPTNTRELPCGEIRSLLSARHDGEPIDTSVLDPHLAACAACRSFASELPSTSGLFDELRRSEPRAGALDELMERAERAVEPRVPARSWGLRAVAASIGFLGIFVLGRDRAGVPQPDLAHSPALQSLARAGRAFSRPAVIDELSARAFMAHLAPDLEPEDRR